MGMEKAVPTLTTTTTTTHHYHSLITDRMTIRERLNYLFSLKSKTSSSGNKAKSKVGAGGRTKGVNGMLMEVGQMWTLKRGPCPRKLTSG